MSQYLHEVAKVLEFQLYKLMSLQTIWSERRNNQKNKLKVLEMKATKHT